MNLSCAPETPFIVTVSDIYPKPFWFTETIKKIWISSEVFDLWSDFSSWFQSDGGVSNASHVFWLMPSVFLGWHSLNDAESVLVCFLVGKVLANISTLSETLDKLVSFCVDLCVADNAGVVRHVYSDNTAGLWRTASISLSGAVQTFFFFFF